VLSRTVSGKRQLWKSARESYRWDSIPDPDCVTSLRWTQLRITFLLRKLMARESPKCSTQRLNQARSRTSSVLPVPDHANVADSCINEDRTTEIGETEGQATPGPRLHSRQNNLKHNRIVWTHTSSFQSNNFGHTTRKKAPLKCRSVSLTDYIQQHSRGQPSSYKITFRHITNTSIRPLPMEHELGSTSYICDW
jgi:hypothetical protein